MINRMAQESGVVTDSVMQSLRAELDETKRESSEARKLASSANKSVETATREASEAREAAGSAITSVEAANREAAEARQLASESKTAAEQAKRDAQASSETAATAKNQSNTSLEAAAQANQRVQQFDAGFIDRLTIELANRGILPRVWRTYAVPSQRNRDITYTNNTKAEILLHVRSTQAVLSAGLSVELDQGLSTAISIQSGLIGGLLGNRQDLSVIVPPGSTYRVTGRDIQEWQECRAD